MRPAHPECTVAGRGLAKGLDAYRQPDSLRLTAHQCSSGVPKLAQ